MEKQDRHRMQRALREAQLHGHLLARHGRLYYPGSASPLCGVQTSKEIVRSGWLKYRNGKYVITPEGLSALAAAEGVGATDEVSDLSGGAVEAPHQGQEPPAPGTEPRDVRRSMLFSIRRLWRFWVSET
jgi:hypothetical protein